MIVGVGTDIVLLSRIARVLNRNESRFLRRAFHPLEIQKFHLINQQLLKDGAPYSDSDAAIKYIAGRWAVKESVYKALGGAWRIPFPDVLCSSQRDGKRPSIEIMNASKEYLTLYGVSAFHASLSHDGDYVVALVIAEGR